METTLTDDKISLEIDLACRTLRAVDPAAARAITVVLPTESGAAPCLATRIAQRYGFDAIVTSGRRAIRVRIVRRVTEPSASPARR